VLESDELLMYDPEDEAEEAEEAMAAGAAPTTEAQLTKALSRAKEEISMLREEVDRRTARLAEIMEEKWQRAEESSEEESSDDEMPGLGGGKAGSGSRGGGRGGSGGNIGGCGKEDLQDEASMALLAYYAQKGLSEEEMTARVKQALKVD